MADKNSKTAKRKRSIVGDALRGRWISTKFFSRYWGAILALVVLVMFYITNRYQCTTAMETIQKLEHELQVVKSERIREKSIYMSSIRESAMQQRINDLNLGLRVSEQPPYKISRK